MLAFPQAMQPGLSTWGPQWNAARSTHHRIAWLARESSKPGRGAGRALDRAGQRRLVAGAPATTTPRACKPSCSRPLPKSPAFAPSPAHQDMQRWSYAKTMQPLGKTHLWDAKTGIGAVRRLVPGPPGGRRLCLRPGTGAGLFSLALPEHDAAWPRLRHARASPLHRPLCPLAHRPAACGLAGGGAGQLARCPRARRASGWCASKTSTRRAACRAWTSSSCSNSRLRPGRPTQPPVWQSQRTRALPGRARPTGGAQGLAYPCGCSRKDIENALLRKGHERTRHGELIYPGTCRNGLHGQAAPEPGGCAPDIFKPNRPLAHLAAAQAAIHSDSKQRPFLWTDRRFGPQQQNVATRRGRLRAAAAPTAATPTSWPWWWTTPTRHHRRGARRRPDRQHRASNRAAARPGSAHPALPAHAAGAAAPTAKNSPSKTVQPRWTPADPWSRSTRRASAGAAGTGRVAGEALTAWTSQWDARFGMTHLARSAR